MIQDDSTFRRRLALFPDTARLEAHDGHSRLYIGGCDLAGLAAEHGTPLYVYDRATMDNAVAAYRRALATHYPGQSGITYAGKAFLCLAVAQWAGRQGLWLDCTGIGELQVAAAAAVPRAQILVHGVNKSPADLAAAVIQAGTIVVDNLTELERLADLVEQPQRGSGHCPDLWIRIRPGLPVDTYAFNQTGQNDSKFGMDFNEAMTAIRLCRQRHLPLTGVHFHQGSHFHDPAPIAPALARTLDLVAAMQTQAGWLPRFLSPGGGWGTAYHEDELPHPALETYVRFVAEELAAGCRVRGLPLLHLHLEPGRSVVARAGVALYRVGAVKHTASRRWLLLDGGLADNPRPALYGARYSALPVVGPERPGIGPAWLAGPYCESGDVLIEGLPLPDLWPGDLVAVPVSGAYQVGLSSNYNGAARPAIVWLEQGHARLIRRRETGEDLVRRDLCLDGEGDGETGRGGAEAD